MNDPGRPVDTLHAPHEPVVETRSTVGTWTFVLAGPVIWIVHFGVVYLNAETACEAAATDQMTYFGTTVLTWLVVVATVVAVVMITIAGSIARRRAGRPGSSGMYRVGTILSAGSVFAVLAVGLPILWLEPC